MDGNTFIRHFYTFLHSKSLVYKLTIFCEWHHDWLKPWLHYIPWSLRGDKYVETVRYLTQEEGGRARAPRLISHKRDWAQRALRNEDLEAWFFRLLLEYGWAIDDQREMIGYSMP
ncbi:MAG: capsule-associated protein CAP1 [Lichina confinis]|nr:MAG: capsule-associated protein CAP1 [Lichina confinis]